ncbi:MAG: bifunctional demethylmenaquinone methyltransferase/2-methoxy-6-polyprenyl-1,4-benzoquinol methylase UbiE [Gammaproteobacteria bacterium]|nr:bifunctional demethylmenaquinone methyltransferase/2-methoxy-6-polyprenyl-1,4-benzoquinol methylase UbiE [Gammaproteobacteria bacterium]MBI5617877.1 bifunctional demethylmenaquinone methyltransferase/2-methoxy-6-polyprenyl-1,4-benzoquinol methylase UbiE [Gammaproteobacteria bacterium]
MSGEDREDENKPEVDFGYERVSPREKTARVRDVFDSVASRYDIMNDLMSMGLHRIWKRFAVSIAHVRPGQRALDIAGGSGDLTKLLAADVGPEGEVVCADINRAMLEVGRDKLLDAGVCSNVRFVQANAEHLPFAERYFDLVTIAFGLRNVTHKELALAEMHRVLKPGGRAIILEFSQVRPALLSKLYDAYSFAILPRLGSLVAGDAESYRYLAESIRMHPDQNTLKSMMELAGFERCRYHNIAGGVCAVHVGYRL